MDFFTPPNQWMNWWIGWKQQTTQRRWLRRWWCRICSHQSMISPRKNNPKTSQGGLTSPKLSDLGLDFPNRGRKTRKRRQVRISCINVTDRLSSVVFISHPNQLHKCHTSRFVESQVWQKCFTESVAEMSLWQECHTSRFVGCQVAKMSLLQKCHTWVRIGPITPESHLRPPQWKSGIKPLQWKSSPLRGNLGLTPPVEICKVIRS